MIEAFAPICALAVNFVFQAAVHRALRVGYLGTMGLGTAAGLIGQIFIWYLVNDGAFGAEATVKLLGQSAVYLCLSFGLFAFANLWEGSLRVRLLREIAAQPVGLPIAALAGRYSEQNILSVRLDRLTGAGQLRRDGQRYVLTGKVLPLLAKTMLGMKLLLLGKRSEFENS